MLPLVSPPNVAQIVASGACIGCGICQSIAGPDRIALTSTERGTERPRVRGPLPPHIERRIAEVCPGIHVGGSVRRGRLSRADDHPIWGVAYDIVRAYASDPDVRFRGASSGTLSALARYLLDRGDVAFVLHVAASRDRPVRSTRHVSFDAADVLEGAGSRYGPAAPLTDFCQLLDRGQRFAVVGKPCDIAAVRNLARLDGRVKNLVPYLLSMMCGGVSELGVSLDLLRRFGVAEGDVALLRYRGHGNPGPTRVETRDGRAFETTYNDLWGGDPSSSQLQFRCKICPDSIGDQADIVAFDLFPDATPDGENEGWNGLMARTPAGLMLLRDALRDDAIRAAGKISFADIETFQPHQAARRKAAFPRSVAVSLTTGVRLRYGARRLIRAAMVAGPRVFFAEFAGAARRVRAGRHKEAAP